MPTQYTAIRDDFIRKGMKTKLAKTHAAKIYNSTHKENPVGRYSDQPKPERTKDGY